MAGSLYDQVVAELSYGRTNLRGDRATALLRSLGFEVKEGRLGGHRVFTHDGLADFHSSSFNAGHGKNPEIKPSYVRNILRVLKEHESALRSYLGEDGDGE